MENDSIISMNKALSRINGLYQKWFQTRTLNSYLIQTLNALFMEPDLTQKEISDKYQIPRQTVNNAIQALKKEGYVELIQNENDKRWKKILFTEKGQKYAEETVLPLLTLDQKIAKRMGTTKYHQFITLLQEYGDSLEHEIVESKETIHEKR